MKIVPETATVDQRDFTCLLFYGMTCQEARQDNRSGGTTVASAVIGEQVSSILDHSLTDTAKPDIFRLEAGGENQETISKVTVGKNLNDRLSFEFTSDFAPEVAERTIKTNYFFNDNVLFSARRTNSLDQDNRYRFNLILRFESR